MSEPLDSRQIKQIGHEARKPLVSLISTTELLLAGLEGELSEQIRKDITSVKANAEIALIQIDLLIEKLAYNSN